MKASDSLFRLIKSLTKNEKGYFKKMAEALAGGGGSNYLLLFDAIDKQEEFDEAAIIKKYSTENFVKNLSVTKRNLTDLILKALRLYQSSSNVRSEINALLENADILFARLLYKEAFDSIEKARALAAEIDLPLQMLDADNKARVFNMELAWKDWDTTIERYIVSLKETSDAQRQSIEITELHYRLFYFWKHERLIRTDEQLAYIESLMTSPLLNIDPQTLGFYPRQTLLTIRMIYCFLKNDTQQAFDFYLQVIELWEASPAIKKDQPLRYIAALNNHFSNCMRIKRHDLISTYLQNPDLSFMAGNETARATWFILIATFKLVVLEQEGSVGNMLKALPPIQTELAEHEPRLNPVDVMLLRYNMLLIYFIAEKFDAALTLVNELMDLRDLDLRTDIQAATRIINLIVHYELGNQVLLDNAIKNTRRYLQKREKYFELEKVFFRYFSKLSLLAGKEEKAKVYTGLKAELIAVTAAHPFEKNFLQTFNFLGWLNARAQGVSLQNYYSQNVDELA